MIRRRRSRCGGDVGAGGDVSRCRGEGSGEGVPGGGEDVPAVRRDGFAHDLVMHLETGGHTIPVSLPQPGGALNVGEEEAGTHGGGYFWEPTPTRPRLPGGHPAEASASSADQWPDR